ncbi:unnamed protein product [Pedinophyceae sp. YPF-701]|nr:unnamed protein product [Pedinophyceae sp. YPF-701]
MASAGGLGAAPRVTYGVVSLPGDRYGSLNQDWAGHTLITKDSATDKHENVHAKPAKGLSRISMSFRRREERKEEEKIAQKQGNTVDMTPKTVSRRSLMQVPAANGADTSGHGEPCLCVCVMDGHGILGERAAMVGGMWVLNAVQEARWDLSALVLKGEHELETTLTQIFNDAHAKVISTYSDAPKEYHYPQGVPHAVKYKIKQMMGCPVYTPTNSRVAEPRLIEFGSTATVVLVQGSKLCVAHCGDSLVALGRKGASGKFTGSILTRRHTGNDHNECKRIQTHFGHCTGIGEDGYIGIRTGPWQGFELAVTRAIGHKLMESYGVVAAPTVQVMEVPPDACCLVVATDGVWDAMGAQDVIDLVMEEVQGGASPEQAAKALANKAIELQCLTGDADNTTVGLVLF